MAPVLLFQINHFCFKKLAVLIQKLLRIAGRLRTKAGSRFVLNVNRHGSETVLSGSGTVYNGTYIYYVKIVNIIIIKKTS